MVAFYLCIVVAAIGASELYEKEGPDDRPNAEPGSPAAGVQPDTHARRTLPTVVESVQVGQVDVVPAGEPASVAVSTSVLAVELGYDDLYCSYPWDCATALRVFHLENRAQNPEAISRTGDYGLCQINRRTWEAWLNERGFNFASEWMIPERNVAMAWEIQKEHGWDEWTTY